MYSHMSVSYPSYTWSKRTFRLASQYLETSTQDIEIIATIAAMHQKKTKTKTKTKTKKRKNERVTFLMHRDECIVIVQTLSMVWCFYFPRIEIFFLLTDTFQRLEAIRCPPLWSIIVCPWLKVKKERFVNSWIF